VTDADTGDVITATLTLANVATGSLTANNGATYNAATGVWQISGSVATVNTALAGAAFVPAANNTTATTVTTLIRDAANTGPMAGTVTLAIGQSSLSGRVYVDNNNDGVFTGHATIPNVTITLQQPVDSSDLTKGWVDVPAGVAADPHQQTNDQGWYGFTGLPAGKYRAVETQPAAFMEGGPNTIVVDLAAGAARSDVNFGDLGLKLQYISKRLFLASTPPMATIVRSINAAPALDLNGPTQSGSDTSAKFYPGGGPLKIAPAAATLADADSPSLVSLVVTITNPLDGGQETLDADVTGTNLVKSYANGVLTLSGVDFLSPRQLDGKTDHTTNYQSVLRTVTYNDTAATPNFHEDRRITFVACDGIAYSTLATATVTDPPLPSPIAAASPAAAVAPQAAPAPSAPQPVSGGAASVVRSGDEVVVTGTPGDDAIVVHAGPFQTTVVVNGCNYSYDAAEVKRFTIDGGGGNDAAQLTGTSGAETARLAPGSATIRAAGYAVDVARVRNIIFNGNGGDDDAWLVDSAGNDTLKAKGNFASLSGDGFAETALACKRVRACATAGGSDKAIEEAIDYVLEKEGAWQTS
jgi:hypothetical protein